MRSATGSRWCSCRLTWSSRRDRPRSSGGSISTGCSRWPTAATSGPWPGTAPRWLSGTARCGKGRPELAWAFDRPLAARGRRRSWQRGSAGPRHAAERFTAEFDCLGERGAATLRYRGDRRSSPIPAAWTQALAGAPDGGPRPAGLTTVGPHRDDLAARDRRAAAPGVRLDRAAAQRRGRAQAARARDAARRPRRPSPRSCWTTSSPSWTTSARQRLASRLSGPGDRQVFLTAPRRDELPRGAAPGGAGGRGMAEVRRRRRVSEPRQPVHARRRAGELPASQSGFAKRLQQAGGGRGVGRAGRAADRGGHRARIGHPGRDAPGPGRHRGLGQRAEPHDAADPGPDQCGPTGQSEGDSLGAGSARSASKLNL